MKLHAKFLNAQNFFPQFVPLRFPDQYADCPDPSTSPANSVCPPLSGSNDSDGNPLACAGRASLARLRDTDREAWFVDDDASLHAAYASHADAGPNA